MLTDARIFPLRIFEYGFSMSARAPSDAVAYPLRRVVRLEFSLSAW